MGDPGVTTKVLLVDDHPTILMGLRCLLDAEPDLEVVGAEQNGTDALAAFVRTLPDVVLLDLSIPGDDGLSLMRRLREHDPAARVLVLTSSFDVDTVSRVMRAGADGYQLKDCPPEELVMAIRSVVRGGMPVDARVTRWLLEPEARPASSDLTDREEEVLRLVGLGLANKQIASRLGIGESTVKTHLSSVFRRIGVVDRTSAALWATQHLRQAVPG